MKNKLFQNTYIDVININDLITDEYQRMSENNSPRRIRKMINNFNSDLLSTITVSLRNGKYYVVDGQHRVLAARSVGLKALRAEVHNNLTKEDEAALFVMLNSSSTKVNKIQIYNAHVIAKDPTTLRIKFIAASNGLKIGSWTEDNTLSAYGTLEKVYTTLGEDLLDVALHLIKSTWGGDSSSMNRYFIEGVAYFIEIYQSEENYTHDKFIKQLSKVSATKLFAEMKADTTSSKLRIKAMNTLHRYYNTRLNKQLPHKHFNS